jgi:hypothetical protein
VKQEKEKLDQNPESQDVKSLQKELEQFAKLLKQEKEKLDQNPEEVSEMQQGQGTGGG